jgi:hypothetical protein
MKRVCEYCLSEFEGPRQARFCSDAHRKAFARSPGERARQDADLDPSLPERQFDMAEPVQELPVPLLVEQARAGKLRLSGEDEQRIRKFFGYADSETRTLAERDAAAARMLGRSSSFPSEQEYVERVLDGARAHHERTSSGATLSTVSLSDRLRRAEAYARWRYRGFLRGEVASL